MAQSQVAASDAPPQPPPPAPTALVTFRDAARARVAASPTLEHVPLAATMDASRWRKRVGITADVRTFVCHSGFPDFRDALVARGFKQVPDYRSPHFDLKWALKSKDVDHRALLPHQAVNHFDKSMAICTKAGLLHCLRSANWFAAVDERSIGPRAYDLADPGDYADFVEDFQAVEAEKILRSATVAVLLAAIAAGAVTAEQLVPGGLGGAAGGSVAAAALGGSKVPFDRALYLPSAAMARLLCAPRVVAFAASAACPLFNLGVVQAALSVTRKRCRDWDDVMLDDATAPEEPVVLPREWEVLRFCDLFAIGGPVEQAPGALRAEAEQRAKETSDNTKRDREIKRLLRRQGREAAAGAIFSRGGIVAADGSMTAAVAASAAISAAAAAKGSSARVAESEDDYALASGDDDAGDEDEDGDDDDVDEGDDEDGEDGGENGDGDDGAAELIRGITMSGARRAGVAPLQAAVAAPAMAAAPSSSTAPSLPPPREAKSLQFLTQRREWGFGSGAAKAASAAAVAASAGSDSEGEPQAEGGGRRRIEHRNGGVVGQVQLRMWRERMLREGSGADASVFSDSVGDPPPTVSASAEPELASLGRMGGEAWCGLVAALGAVNDRPALQSSLNGCPPKNVWIVKPAGKSRGRGIECENSLSQILLQRGGKAKESHWIVQKYIERPLLIHARKWDIRQWVLVSSWNPLTVWMYRRCYLRFCSYPFELGNLSNKYIHLSNNSIQKHSAAFEASDIEGNMWHMEQFARWLQLRAREGAFDGLAYTPERDAAPAAEAARGRSRAPAARPDAGAGPSGPPLVQDAAELLNRMEAAGGGAVAADEPAPLPVSGCADVWGAVLQPQIRRIIAQSLQCAQDAIEGRPCSFEVYGFDFMVDADLHPWLIEINSSPDFSYSTAVTEELVREASDGIAAVVVEHRDWEREVAAVKARAKASRAGACAGASAGSGSRGGSGSARSLPPRARPAVDAPSPSQPQQPPPPPPPSLPSLPPSPDTGGWECIYRSPVALGHALTCTATDMQVTGAHIASPAETARRSRGGAAAVAAAVGDCGNGGSGGASVGAGGAGKPSLRTRLLAAAALDAELRLQQVAASTAQAQPQQAKELAPSVRAAAAAAQRAAASLLSQAAVPAAPRLALQPLLKPPPTAKVALALSTGIVSFDPMTVDPALAASTRSAQRQGSR